MIPVRAIKICASIQIRGHACFGEYFRPAGRQVFHQQRIAEKQGGNGLQEGCAVICLRTLYQYTTRQHTPLVRFSGNAGHFYHRLRAFRSFANGLQGSGIDTQGGGLRFQLMDNALRLCGSFACPGFLRFAHGRQHFGKALSFAVFRRFTCYRQLGNIHEAVQILRPARFRPCAG